MDEFLKQNLKKLILLQGTFTLETDRGCALMAAAFLETELENLLKLKLVGTRKQIEELFKYNSPLGNFSSKIKFSYALGLISKSILQDLEIIRTIRNEFGHEYKPLSFSTRAINDRIVNLKSHLNEKNAATARETFLSTVLAILALIHSETNHATKYKEKEDLQLTDEEKKLVNERTSSFAKEIVATHGKEGQIYLSDKTIQTLAEKLATADTLKWEQPTNDPL